MFELEPDEALIIENHIRLKPQYIGFQVGNLWGESIEYANQIGSLNGHQTTVDADGIIRIVLAHSDPGVPNWVDTTGHREGFMTPRWTYSETPAPEDWPTITAKKVPFSEIRQHSPDGTGSVTPEERRQQITFGNGMCRSATGCFSVCRLGTAYCTGVGKGPPASALGSRGTLLVQKAHSQQGTPGPTALHRAYFQRRTTVALAWPDVRAGLESE